VPRQLIFGSSAAGVNDIDYASLAPDSQVITFTFL